MTQSGTESGAGLRQQQLAAERWAEHRRRELDPNHAQGRSREVDRSQDKGLEQPDPQAKDRDGPEIDFD